MRLGRCGDCQFDIRVGVDGVEMAYDDKGEFIGPHYEYCHCGRQKQNWGIPLKSGAGEQKETTNEH